MIDDHVTTLDEIPSAPCYVIATDGWFSGWGYAEGKRNILIVPCSDDDEARAVKVRLRSRSEMRGVARVASIETIPDDWFAQVKVAADVLTWRPDKQVRPPSIPGPADVLDALRYPNERTDR